MLSNGKRRLSDAFQADAAPLWLRRQRMRLQDRCVNPPPPTLEVYDTHCCQPAGFCFALLCPFTARGLVACGCTSNICPPWPIAAYADPASPPHGLPRVNATSCLPRAAAAPGQWADGEPSGP
ncbi:unnamed protein product [Ostreobium quekettii]|uniref:Uncharacterized protein n=1 Tax=Ostreobium quekettii TaxID=121088 RepID=A0A8S1IQI9_9CHLO|nr:unnamed protein product [Ostreobium quekettii]